MSIQFHLLFFVHVISFYVHSGICVYIYIYRIHYYTQTLYTYHMRQTPAHSGCSLPTTRYLGANSAVGQGCEEQAAGPPEGRGVP